MFRRIGTNSLRGDAVCERNIKPSVAIARYLELKAVDLIPDNPEDPKRYNLPEIIAQRNPTLPGRVYLIQFHPAIGRAPQVIECLTNYNIFEGYQALTAKQVENNYVVRIYELNPQTAL